jgi:adenylylsulfate kinase
MNSSTNTVWHNATVTRARREKLKNHKSVVIWFTGLSGSGKSTLAHTVEEKLHQKNCSTFVFDGDNVRHGLCSDLGFSDNDRTENIRRIAEMCNLFIDAGVISLTAFISPFKKDRESVKKLLKENDYIEVYCKCTIEKCEKRDVKGLYKKARQGLVKKFTGISSPYEEPENPDLVLDTDKRSLDECVEDVIKFLEDRSIV